MLLADLLALFVRGLFMGFIVAVLGVELQGVNVEGKA